jgi:copper(I)-binding protein
MLYKSTVAAIAIFASAPAFAEITVSDAYARASTPMSKSGAVFMAITNTGDDDRVVGATSDAAERVELHTHIQEAGGVMKMAEVKEGFALPSGSTHMLERGSDHIMFMGLTSPFEDGKTIHVTLTFEKAAPLEIEVPVDSQRSPQSTGAMDMKNNSTKGHDHSNMEK